jgi:hypothetical protein
MNPQKIIAIGFVLVVLGLVIPLLMVVQFIGDNFILAFLAYGASVGGLVSGLIGTALYRQVDRSKQL